MRNVRTAAGVLSLIFAASLAVAAPVSAADATIIAPGLPEFLTPAEIAAVVEPELAMVAVVPHPSKGVLLETGIASTYGTGDGFQGNRTACGQIFDTYIPQVAHKTLPCGTMVRVEDAETGESVTVEVTDRGPYIKGRVVDLSWAAFRKLDPSAPGLRPVSVYVLPKG